MSGLRKFFEYLFGGRFDKIIGAIRQRIPPFIYYRAKGYIFELHNEDHDQSAPPPRFPEGYAPRLACREEMPECSRITGHNVDEFYRRYDAGDLCYGVFDGKRPVNINWIHRGGCYIRGMGYFHNGDNNDSYIYGIMTDRAEQGKGIYQNCLRSLADYLFENGDKKLVQMVEDGNEPVLHTLPGLGYRKVKIVKYSCMLGIKHTVAVDVGERRTARRFFIGAPRGVYII
jgi:RimJ/RimL family protein N-acetyltransferase